jgi:hypothetical protein
MKRVQACVDAREHHILQLFLKCTVTFRTHSVFGTLWSVYYCYTATTPLPPKHFPRFIALPLETLKWSVHDAPLSLFISEITELNYVKFGIRGLHWKVSVGYDSNPYRFMSQFYFRQSSNRTFISKKQLILRKEIVYNRHASFTLTPDITLFRIKPLKTKRNLLYIRNQPVPRLYKPVSRLYVKQKSLSVLRSVLNTERKASTM